MDITIQDVIEFILKNSSNGVVNIDVKGTEIIIITDDLKEEHDFKYSQIVLSREDLTIKEQEARNVLKELGKE